MKPRTIIKVGLLLTAALAAALWLRSADSGPKMVAQTRRDLRAQGMKVDLDEFTSPLPADMRSRLAAILPIRPSGPSAPVRVYFELLAPVGADSALVVWKQDKLETYQGEHVWLTLDKALDANRAQLDLACGAVLAGPIRFELNQKANPGAGAYLGPMRNLSQALANRVVIELHAGRKDEAWTNLLALTRLVTAWDVEPAETSHLVRTTIATTAYNATWQASQAGGWNDQRLADMQHEWESVDFFKGLPDTAAFDRANQAALCELVRAQPLRPGIMPLELLRAPRMAWSGINLYLQELRYRRHGSYDDENSLLLYHRDRELELRRAIQCATWSEMRALPGVTNLAPFKSKYALGIQSMVNARMVSAGLQMSGMGLPARVAESEARRRILVTALALERFRGRHGAYPDALSRLAPEFLATPLVDFMDGQPLRYRRTEDGHFVLYSVGLDCIDDNGKMPAERDRGQPMRAGLRFADRAGTDLVWPRPATADEAAALQEEHQRRAEEREALQEKNELAREKQAELARQRTVEKLLADEAERKIERQNSTNRPVEPVYHGQPLAQAIRNEKIPGASQLALEDLLTLKQIITGQEPDTVTFELPVSYEAVTNLGTVHLLVDAEEKELAFSRSEDMEDCTRATNGNCLLAWNTTFDSPGQHALQAQLVYQGSNRDASEAKGPVFAYYSSNLCQFNPGYANFDSFGAIFYARLAESNGFYKIEIKSPAGEHVQTITGVTSNGIVKVRWDLTDGRGRKYTNGAMESTFEITLPDSGRTQKFR